ncbi:MAG: 2-oxoglutarate and iron-dependent oxygenase domain-containing protein, partial [Pseudomonadota bacterium]
MNDMVIPILDWQRFLSETTRAEFAVDLGRACRDTGFFVLTGHGIDAALIDKVFQAADTFFGLPRDEKARLDIRASGTNRGWAEIGTENLDDTSDAFDRKEAFNIGLDLAADDPRILKGEPFRGLNLWPDLPGFRETLLTYFASVHRLGVDLHRPIALDLNLDEAYFAPYLDQPLATLRLLRYPAGGSDGIGAGAHTDYGSVTLLIT